MPGFASKAFVAATWPTSQAHNRKFVSRALLLLKCAPFASQAFNWSLISRRRCWLTGLSFSAPIGGAGKGPFFFFRYFFFFFFFWVLGWALEEPVMTMHM
jgi:hypothetical protein